MLNRWMKRMLSCVLAGVVFTQTGCSLALQDAAAAGVYDFVSATVTEMLTSVSPFARVAAAIVAGG